MEPGQFFRMRGFVHLGRIASFSGKVRDHHDPSTDTAIAAHTRGYIGGLMPSFFALRRADGQFAVLMPISAAHSGTGPR